MTQFKAGDKVRLTGEGWDEQWFPGLVAKVERVEANGQVVVADREGDRWYEEDGFEIELLDPEDNPVRPSHYLFPGGVWVSAISKYQTSNGGQALQYIARSTRLDGNNKSDTIEGLIEDLKKAKVFIDWEIERLEEQV